VTSMLSSFRVIVEPQDGGTYEAMLALALDDPLGRRLEDAIAAARTWSPGWRARDWHAAVTAGGFFGEVETARFPHVHEFPGDALDDHLLSYARIAALPDDERGRLTATIREALGDSEPVRIPFVVEAYRAVRV
jgi:hypothetical protein